MNRRSILRCALPISVATMTALAAIVQNAGGQTTNSASSSAQAGQIEFPDGTATPSELCGSCHQAIYKEYAEGFGSDLQWPTMQDYPAADPVMHVLDGVANGMAPTATAHAAAGNDPWPLDARNVEQHGKLCNVCHFPQPMEYPDLNAKRIEKPKPRAADQEAGITCASCHLTPDGKIRGPYEVDAPHATVKDERSTTSVACAFCHSDGERVIGKQTQTFLEWRDDFHNAGLGPQQCQDCHMPKTVRKLAEDFEVPPRIVARHLWTGGHSLQRDGSALTLAIAMANEIGPELTFHVANVGAGHSVPSGSNRRAVYLTAEVSDSNDRIVASKEWMFAPWFANRPDDKAFLDEDSKGNDPIATSQADRQGPHETIIRAGEERVLRWIAELPAGRYTVRARLIYDLNRYNDRAFKGDQREMANQALQIRVAASR
jgi:nitrate/TMAO reductase-like tetraheme cytochrome c subunit